MIRADQILVERGLAQSRTQAQRMIRNHQVRYRLSTQWQILSKPGQKLNPNCELQIESCLADSYVSRGALKLLAALEKAELTLEGCVALDVGQSTGGFTDCLLQAGIARVVGIEVGHDQLASRLRQDPRVICYEGVNARALDDSLKQHCRQPAGYDLAVMDVSFISQTHILPSLVPLLAPGALLISLVKPQFEVGKAGIGRGGLVRDSSLYPSVEASVSQCCQTLGMQIEHYFESPITGGDGNREFLLIARKQ
ncbi:TlyA family RNA methyltransferase [Pontibacter sp. JAM-7]|uniref:TlyA family RNA methyltransferase n=1 Tax=Pontibacter sp. JAM-7 TaxID=3366581 RepID=UPI003AF52881